MFHFSFNDSENLLSSFELMMVVINSLPSKAGGKKTHKTQHTQSAAGNVKVSMTLAQNDGDLVSLVLIHSTPPV